MPPDNSMQRTALRAAADAERWADETNQPAEVIQIESEIQNP